MSESEMLNTRLDLSLRAKNGLNFTFTAALIWAGIAFIWTLDDHPKQLGFYTFFAGMPLVPIAWLIGRWIGAEFQIKDNALAPLGLILNFAQLFYFPLLIFAFSFNPEDFVMVYAVITGAHFFPYYWFYKAPGYAVFAGVIPVMATALGVNTGLEQKWYIAAATSILLLLLTGIMYLDWRKKSGRGV